MSKQGVVNIRGKQYKTVVLRVNEFREKYKPEDGWSIQTWLISDDGDRVVTRTVICDKDDHIVATGLAEEVRGSSNINKTSALENCETSSLGRALAAFGLGGEEYCSADELVRAIAQQDAPQPKSNPAPKEEKEKPDGKKRIVKYLEDLEGLVGEEEAQKRWVTLLKHSDHAEGALSLGDIKDFSKLWRLSDEVKEMVEATAATIEKEKEEE